MSIQRMIICCESLITSVYWLSVLCLNLNAVVYSIGLKLI